MDKLICPICGGNMKPTYGGFGCDNKYACEECQTILYAAKLDALEMQGWKRKKENEQGREKIYRQYVLHNQHLHFAYDKMTDKIVTHGQYVCYEEIGALSLNEDTIQAMAEVIDDMREEIDSGKEN